MSKRFWKSIGVRLVLWYSGVFVVTSLIMFVLASILLRTYLVGQDKDFIQAEIHEFQGRYEDQGFDQMLKELDQEVRRSGAEAVYFRVADENNRALFSNPARFSEYNLAALEKPGPVRENKWVRLKKSGDEDVLDVYTVRLANGKVLQVGKSSEERNEPIERFLSIASLVVGPIVIFGVLGGVFLSSRMLRPIRSLIAAVQAVTDTGQLGARLPVRGAHDEMDNLAVLFNRMLGRIEHLVDGMRDALDNVAHDLRTPMTRLRNTAEAALLAGGVPESRQEALADCLEQSDEALTILRTLMDVSEAETGTLKLNRETVRVGDVVADVIDLYGPVAEEKGISLQAVGDASLAINADRSRFKQTLGNLIDNALKYSPAGGRVSLESSADGGLVRIAVRDAGEGIPADELPRIWDRHFRGERARTRPGLGLGLSLVRAIVRAHGGEVSAESHTDRGSVFTVSFPSL